MDEEDDMMSVDAKRYCHPGRNNPSAPRPSGRPSRPLHSGGRDGSLSRARVHVRRISATRGGYLGVLAP